MKIKSLIFTGIFSVILIASNAQKIGHVDIEKIILDMPNYKTAMDSLQKENKRMQKKLQAMEYGYTNAKRIYDDSAKFWDATMRQIRANELSTQQTNYQIVYQSATKDLDSLQGVVLNRLIGKVKKAAGTIAKQKGITYVLNYSEQAQLVLYYEESHDLTALVRKELGLP